MADDDINMGSAPAAEPRIVKEEGLDARVAQVVQPVVEDLGYRLVRVRMIDHNGLASDVRCLFRG